MGITPAHTGRRESEGRGSVPAGTVAAPIASTDVRPWGCGGRLRYRWNLAFRSTGAGSSHFPRLRLLGLELFREFVSSARPDLDDEAEVGSCARSGAARLALSLLRLLVRRKKRRTNPSAKMAGCRKLLLHKG